MKNKQEIVLSILICFLLLLSSCGICIAEDLPNKVVQNPRLSDLALKYAKSYLKVREIDNRNRSPEIDLWHRWHGLGYGNPYCQMFVNYSYNLAFNELGKRTPLLKSPRCSTFAKWCVNNPLIVKSISIKQIRMGYKLQPGDILGWKHGLGDSPGGFTYNGHAGMVQYQIDNNWLLTIEGNTKPSDKGDQTGRDVGDTRYGNDGVYERTRNFGIGTKFPILFAFRLQCLTF